MPHATRPLTLGTGNHHTIFKRAGLTVQTYRYYNAADRSLDFDGFVADLQARISRSDIVMSHDEAIRLHQSMRLSYCMHARIIPLAWTRPRSSGPCWQTSSRCGKC